MTTIEMQKKIEQLEKELLDSKKTIETYENKINRISYSMDLYELFYEIVMENAACYDITPEDTYTAVYIYLQNFIQDEDNIFVYINLLEAMERLKSQNNLKIHPSKCFEKRIQIIEKFNTLMIITMEAFERKYDMRISSIVYNYENDENVYLYNDENPFYMLTYIMSIIMQFCIAQKPRTRINKEYSDNFYLEIADRLVFLFNSNGRHLLPYSKLKDIHYKNMAIPKNWRSLYKDFRDKKITISDIVKETGLSKRYIGQLIHYTKYGIHSCNNSERVEIYEEEETT